MQFHCIPQYMLSRKPVNNSLSGLDYQFIWTSGLYLSFNTQHNTGVYWDANTHLKEMLCISHADINIIFSTKTNKQLLIIFRVWR